MDNSGAVGSGGVQGGASSSAISRGFDAPEASFENSQQIAQEMDVQMEQPVQGEVFSTPEESDRIMDIPGTPHDKLVGIVDMKTYEGVVNGKDEKKTKEDEAHRKSENRVNNKEEISIEQKIILAQAEALKYMAKSLDKKPDDKEKKVLLEKLKKLLEELDQSDSSKKATLVGTVLNVILLLLSIAEKGAEQLEKEAKRDH